jgi:hypothetical protein
MKSDDDIRALFEEVATSQDSEAEAFWDSLSVDDQMKAFHAVVKRIVKGELQDKGSYRYVLYDIFGFDKDAYLMGMNCGYMDLHNSIFEYPPGDKNTTVEQKWKCPIDKEDCMTDCGDYGCGN